MQDTATRDPAPTNGAPPVDPLARFDPDVQATAAAQQALVDEHARHDTAVAEILGGTPEQLRPLVDDWRRRRFGTARPVGRPRGATTRPRT